MVNMASRRAATFQRKSLGLFLPRAIPTAFNYVLFALLSLLTAGLALPPNANAGAGKLKLNEARSIIVIVFGADKPGIDTEISVSPYDLVVLNGPLQTTQKITSDPNNSKLIFGFINATEADPSFFSSGSLPSWFGNQDPMWPGQYTVKYWNSAWKQEIISRLDALIDAGADGVFFDAAMGDLWWSQGNPAGNPENPNALQDLTRFFADIRSHVASRNLGHPFYIMANNPTGIAINDPASLANFDAVYNEVLYFNSTGLTSAGAERSSPAAVQWILSTLAPAYNGANALVFGNDYPQPMSNLAEDLNSFATYSLLGWIPSVVDSANNELTLVNGPFMAMAVPANPLVTGAPNLVNFLSGGRVPAATLQGGSKGDYFIGGPGTNTIQGGTGNDTIYAHPAIAAKKDLLEISVAAINPSVAVPSIAIQINGITALPATPVSADRANNQTQTYQFSTKTYGPVISLVITASGITWIDASRNNKLFINSISLEGKDVSLTSGLASNPNEAPGPYINYNESISFPASVLPPSSFLADTRDTIDGGGGFDTVIYRGAYSNYAITQNSDGSWVVTSANTAEGPDTLKNIQLLQFSDGQAVPVREGWNLLGNSTGSPMIVATSFSDATKVVSVWKWNSAKSKWAFFTPLMTSQVLADYAASKGYEVLTVISPGEGFWLSTSAATAQQLPPGAGAPVTALQPAGSNPLGMGWNLVSTSDPTMPSQFVTALGGTVTSIWAYDNPTGKWYFYAPSLAAQGGTVLSDYVTAKGYLDFAIGNRALAPGSGFWVNKP